MSTRAERRRWARAATFADVAELTAQWLDGALTHHPGYPGGPPDPETAPIAGALAAANRAGYVTCGSQPGFDGDGYDGARWQQRPAVEGFVDDPVVLRAVGAAAEAAGMLALVHRPTRWRCRPRTAVDVTRTWRGSEGEWVTRTGFGATLSRREIRGMHEGVGSGAVAALCAAWQVTLVDPQWEGGTRLWDTLGAIAGTQSGVDK